MNGREHNCSVVECLTWDWGVYGFEPHQLHCTVSFKSKTHLALHSTCSTQEDLSQHNWKIVDWYVRKKIKHTWIVNHWIIDICIRIFSNALVTHCSIFTFPLRVLAWTFTFEMLFIASWADLFEPREHMPCLGGPKSMPSNNVVCLLTFVWRQAHTAMMLNAGFFLCYV